MDGHVSQNDIYGTYRIDRRLSSWKTANWQYDHFQFEITQNERMILREIDDKGKSHWYIGPITWSDTPTHPALWSAKLNTDHHLLVNSPTLYHSSTGFCYRIHSRKYGNMFFRRTSDLSARDAYAVYEVVLSIAAIAAISFFRYCRMDKP